MLEADQAEEAHLVHPNVWGGNRTWAEGRTQEVLASLLATAAAQDLDPVGILAALQLAASPAVAPFRLTP